MNLKVTRAEIAVGAFLLLAFAGMVAFFIGRGGVETISQPTWKVRAEFGRVTGVRPGTVVRMSGIEIGAVDGVRLTPAGRVEVSMAIRAEYRDWVRQSPEAVEQARSGKDPGEADLARVRLEGDSVVRVESSLLGTGDAAIAIAAGARTLKAAYENDLLVAEPETSAIMETFDKLKKLVGDLSGGEGKQPGGSLGAVLQDDGKMAKEIQALLEHINALLEKSKDSSVGKLLADDGKLYDEINGTVRQAREAIVDLDTSVKKTAESADETIKSVNDTLKTVQDDLKRTTEELRRTLREASDLVAAAREKGLLAAVDGPDGALRKQIDAILAEVHKALEDVKAATAKLPALADEGVKVLGQGTRAAGEAREVASGTKRLWLLKGLFGKKQDEWIRGWDVGPEK